MRRWSALAAILGAISVAAPLLASAKGKSMQRGKYLVRGVALCNDCHTPHDEKGVPDLRRELQGSALPYEPTVKMPWAPAAPSIAGGPKGWTDAALVRLLMTGEGPDGKPLNPPMPPYRMTKEDAEAVVAYIKSVPPPKDAAGGQ